MLGCARSLVVFGVVLVVVVMAAVEAKPANLTDSVESWDDSDEDVDFPEDAGPEQHHQQHPAYSRSPVSVYVLRLLEILLGTESIGKGKGNGQSTRFARDTGGSGSGSYPYPDSAADSGRASTAASYTSYYDFLISEGSYKFWAAFQIGTAVLLTYSAIAALYYARYTYYTNVDYTDYDDYFFKRSSGRSARSAAKQLSGTEFQRVMDAASGAKYTATSSSSQRSS